MKTKYFIIGGAVLVIALIAVLSLVNVFGSGPGTANSAANSATNTQNYNAGNGAPSGSSGNSEGSATASGVQEVTLKVSGSNYIVTPNVLKKGVPVKMTVDLDTVVGCSRDIVISAFGVRKAVRPGDNVIEFTPDKTGLISMACSMNMYRGTFQVTDDGKASANLQNLEPSGSTATGSASASGAGSCGAAGGGCGCMG